MKIYELEKNLAGESWPRIASVFLEGDKKAMPLNSKKSEEHNQAVAETWEKIAVLRALAPKPTKFHIGFSAKDSVQYFNNVFETDLKFGVRLGPDDINFFVLPKDIEDKILLEIVEITSINDENYKELILI